MKRAKLNKKVITAEFREKMRAIALEQWATGKRKKNGTEAYVKCSETLRQGYADGRLKRTTTEQSRLALSKRDPQKYKDIARRLGDLRIGALNPPGPSARGPDHFQAKFWSIKSPDGLIISGMNLNELIRNNENLFLPEDVLWSAKAKRGDQCRASKGLRNLTLLNARGQPYANQWKGWTLVDFRPRAPIPERNT